MTDRRESIGLNQRPPRIIFRSKLPLKLTIPQARPLITFASHLDFIRSINPNIARYKTNTLSNYIDWFQSKCLIICLPVFFWFVYIAVKTFDVLLANIANRFDSLRIADRVHFEIRALSSKIKFQLSRP